MLAFLLAVGVAYRLGVFQAFLTEAPQRPSGQPELCELVRVVDGDTIVVRWRGAEERVRLLRVDTPERGARGYRESTDFLSNFLTGKRIELEFEEAAPARDAMGRLLAYVLADGVNANVEIVRAGWSLFWTKYGRGRYADLLEKAEAEASEGKRGSHGAKSVSGVPSQDGMALHGVVRPVPFRSLKGEVLGGPQASSL